MTKTEIKSHIKAFLTERFQMVLATSGEHPWVSTLYYTCDAELNLYFLSSPATLHCQQIATNSQVAIAIADAPQSPTAKKQGLQLYGLAEQVSGKQKIIHALTLWKNSLKVTSKKYSYEGMVKKLIDGRMYKVTSKKIKLFDQEIWAEGDEPVLEL